MWIERQIGNRMSVLLFQTGLLYGGVDGGRHPGTDGGRLGVGTRQGSQRETRAWRGQAEVCRPHDDDCRTLTRQRRR